MSAAPKACQVNILIAVLRMAGVISLICLSGVLSALSIKQYSRSWWLLWLRQKLYQGIRFCSGIRTCLKGAPECRGIFAVSNHVSYLDIIILGEHAPYTFIAKQEVRQWPVIGWVAQKLGTIFISRTLKGIHRGQQEIAKALSRQHAVLVFAEGTTGNGVITEAFYGAFFELPEGTRIQPISIAYTQANGFPASSYVRRSLGWIGNCDVMSHLWCLVRWKSLTVGVTFHDSFCTRGNRKYDALHAETLIRTGISQNFQ